MRVCQRQAQRPGPLLTRSGLRDTILGLTSEPAVAALTIYAIVVLFGDMLSNKYGMASASAWLSFLGYLTTAGLVARSIPTFRERYPAFARGWHWSRTAANVVAEQLRSFFLGIILLAIFFPIGVFVFSLGATCGPIGWIIVSAIAYAIGCVARRLNTANKSRGGPTP